MAFVCHCLCLDEGFDYGGFDLALLRLLVMTHLARLRSVCAHSANFVSFSICGWRLSMLSMLSLRMAKSCICRGSACVGGCIEVVA